MAEDEGNNEGNDGPEGGGAEDNAGGQTPEAGAEETTAAEQGEQAAAEDAPADSGEQAAGQNVDYEDLSDNTPKRTEKRDEETEHSAQDLEPVYDVPVKVQAVLGKSNLEVSQLLKLAPGAVVELDRKVGEAIDIYVNNRLVARGEVVLVEDHLGVTMTEIIKTDAA